MKLISNYWQTVPMCLITCVNICTNHNRSLVIFLFFINNHRHCIRSSSLFALLINRPGISFFSVWSKSNQQIIESREHLTLVCTGKVIDTGKWSKLCLVLQQKNVWKGGCAIVLFNCIGNEWIRISLQWQETLRLSGVMQKS